MIKTWRFTFRTYLFFLVTGLIVLVTGSLSSIFVWDTKNRLLEQIQGQGEEITRSFSYQAVDGVINNDLAQMRKALNEVILEKAIVYAAIYDYEGNLMLEKHSQPFVKTLDKYRDIQNIRILLQRLSEESKLRVMDFASPVIDITINEALGYVRIGISLSGVEKDLHKAVINAWRIALVFLLLGLILTYFYSIGLSDPIKTISSKMNQIIAENDLSKRLEITSPIKEIELLKNKFNLMLLEMDVNRQNLIRQERVEKELEIAQLLQLSLLPNGNKLKSEWYDVAALMKPAQEVGGDYYDVLKDKQDNTWFGMGDVAGHGVTSGLIMMMAQTATKALVNEYPDLTPRDLIIKLNKVLTENIRENLREDHFMTLTFLVSRSLGHFEYAGRHLDFVVYRKQSNTCELIKTQGIWVGICPDIEDKTFSGQFTLEPDDMLLLYSDGVTEAMNENEEQFEMTRLQDMVIKNQGKGSQGVIKGIIDAVKEHMHEQRDDITLLAIQRKANVQGDNSLHEHANKGDGSND
jgi:serine phosphatase RsbU (regulator of sigma subunit)/uncharacterized membrane protein affecting hemolysin expression